jgi:hypothetical protein
MSWVMRGGEGTIAEPPFFWLFSLPLFAAIAPDKPFTASYSGFGLFVMKPDGIGEASLIPHLGGLAGTANWFA